MTKFMRFAAYVFHRNPSKIEQNSFYAKNLKCFLPFITKISGYHLHFINYIIILKRSKKKYSDSNFDKNKTNLIPGLQIYQKCILAEMKMFHCYANGEFLQ